MQLYIKHTGKNTPHEGFSLYHRHTHTRIFSAGTKGEITSFLEHTFRRMTEKERWEHVLLDLRADAGTLKRGVRKSAWWYELEENYQKAWKGTDEREGISLGDLGKEQPIPYDLVQRILEERAEREEREWRRMEKAKREEPVGSRKEAGAGKAVAETKPSLKPKPTVKEKVGGRTFLKPKKPKPRLMPIDDDGWM